jgi:hypothetical protein
MPVSRLGCLARAPVARSTRFAASTAWTSSHSGLSTIAGFSGIGIAFVWYLAAVKTVLKDQIKRPTGELLTPHIRRRRAAFGACS